MCAKLGTVRDVAIAVLLGALACGESSVGVPMPAFEGIGTEVERCDYDPIAEVGVLGPHVVDDQLKLWVSHGGGCADHAFKLCWDATFAADSLLPVAHLSLVHENNNDTCDGWRGAALAFDLSPLADAWLDAAEHKLGPIQLRIADGFGNESSTVYDPDAEVTCDPLAQDCPAPDLGCLSVASSVPTVACTQARAYAPRGDPCLETPDSPLCEAGLVCHLAAVDEDCSDPTYNDNFPGCCVPACRLGADAPCPDAGQQCVAFTVDGAAADSGQCIYSG
jgi:hypothetical protein